MQETVCTVAILRPNRSHPASRPGPPPATFIAAPVSECPVKPSKSLMKNADQWVPTKFEIRRTRLVPSSDPKRVGVRSRLVSELQAAAYQEAVVGHARGVLGDLGCGFVPLYELYRDITEEVVCVDWPNTLHPSPHLDHHANLNERIPLADATLDTAIATDVIEHLSDPPRFFAETARVLRPGGKLILGVPFLYWIHEAPHDNHRLTRYMLTRLCEANNLTVLSLEEYGGPLAVLLDIAGKNVPGNLSARLFQWCARWVLRSGPGRKIDGRRKRTFPLGYCLVAQKGKGAPDSQPEHSRG
jgi:SAM-dependent methyltransferase